MAFNAYVTHVRRLTALIRLKATGSPVALAKRLKISRSKLFALIKSLREDFDAPIFYDRKRQSYCFEQDGEFFIGFLKK